MPRHTRPPKRRLSKRDTRRWVARMVARAVAEGIHFDPCTACLPYYRARRRHLP